MHQCIKTCLGLNREGVPLVFEDGEPTKCFKLNVVYGRKQTDFVAEIRKLLQFGASQQCEESKTHCILPIKCVPKKQGKLR